MEEVDFKHSIFLIKKIYECWIESETYSSDDRTRMVCLLDSNYKSIIIVRNENNMVSFHVSVSNNQEILCVGTFYHVDDVITCLQKYFKGG